MLVTQNHQLGKGLVRKDAVLVPLRTPMLYDRPPAKLATSPHNHTAAT
jgi:hypothetical protein